MAKQPQGKPAAKSGNADRNNGKAWKKHPKKFDASKRRLVADK